MKWILPEKSDKSLFERIIEKRKIENVDKFINPSLGDLSDPFNIPDMEICVNRILKAIENKEKIFIYGDFDVDGITATSLLWSFLYRELGANVLPFIPNRFTDGYGLSEDNIKKLIIEGGNLIITVDCGIKDIELVSKFSDQIDFIISDHHKPRQTNENVEDSKSLNGYLISGKAIAVIHPKLSDNFSEICGAFVAFKICSALQRKIDRELRIEKYLDLVALGTVCDVMPLVDENRIIVHHGLKILRKSSNKGLRALFEISGLNIEKASTYELGYIIGPKLNASGRLDSAMTGVKLLTTDSERFAEKLANDLDLLNRKRKDLTDQYLDLALKIIKKEGDSPLYFIKGEGWPEGIVGLIAGKLCEIYHKPIIVGSLKDGYIKASARSIAGIDISSALTNFSNYLIRFGGHSLAAGLSITEANYIEFSEKIKAYIKELINDEISQKKIVIDSLVSEDEIEFNVLREILRLEPFGYGNSKPIFALLSLQPQKVFEIGSDGSHLKIFSHNSKVEFLLFNKMNFNFDLISTINKIDVIGNIDIDEWNGREKISFKIKDIRLTK